MRTHDYILTAGEQNRICRRGKFFLERNLFVTSNVIRLFSLVAEAERSSSRICRIPGFSRRAGFAGLFQNSVLRLFDECRKVCANAVSNAKHQFERWVAKPSLNKTQHGLGNARILRDNIIGKVPALAFSSQESDNLVANGFVVTDTRHAEAWQRNGFDIYFAIVKLLGFEKSGS